MRANKASSAALFFEWEDEAFIRLAKDVVNAEDAANDLFEDEVSECVISFPWGVIERLSLISGSSDLTGGPTEDLLEAE